MERKSVRRIRVHDVSPFCQVNDKRFSFLTPTAGWPPFYFNHKTQRRKIKLYHVKLYHISHFCLYGALKHQSRKSSFTDIFLSIFPRVDIHGQTKTTAYQTITTALRDAKSMQHIKHISLSKQNTCSLVLFAALLGSRLCQ